MQSHPAVFRCLCAAPVVLALWTFAQVGQCADETPPEQSTSLPGAERRSTAPRWASSCPRARSKFRCPSGQAPVAGQAPRFPGQPAAGGRPSALPGGRFQQPAVRPRAEAVQTGLPQMIENNQAGQLIRYIRKEQERVEMIVNTSLILSLDKNIPRLQVDNPELLTLTPLSAKQVQIHAKKTGITTFACGTRKPVYTRSKSASRPDTRN